MMHKTLKTRANSILLTLFLLVSFAPLAQAQVGAWHTLTFRTSQSLSGTFYDMGASKPIDYLNMAVTYYETASAGQIQGHFLLNIGGMMGYIFDLPSGISVCDFETDSPNEALFFCGKRKVGDQNVGIYGHVAFNSATSIADYWHCEVSGVVALNKMVLYRESMAHEIFAAAENSLNESKIVFAMCLPNIPSSPSVYRVMDVRPEERLYDVALTDDYAVFLGYESDLGGLSLRKFRRDSPMNTEKDRVYCFAPPTGDALSIPVVADLRASLAKDEENDLAVAFLTSMGNNIYGTKVRVFDVMTMTNTRTQSYKVFEKMDVRDMTYAGTEKTLAILQNGDPLGNASGERSVVCLKPHLSAPYNTDILSWPGALWQSINTFPEDAMTTSHILLGRSDMSYAELTLKNLGSASVLSGCHATYKISVGIETKAPRVEIDNAIQALSINGAPDFDQLMGHNASFNFPCSEQ